MCADVCTVHLPKKVSAPSRHSITWLIGEFFFFLNSGLSRSIAVHGCFIFKGHNRALWTIVIFFLQTPYGSKTEYVPGERGCDVWNLPGKDLSLKSSFCYSLFIMDLKEFGSKLSFKIFLCHVNCFVFLPVIEFTLVTRRKPYERSQFADRFPCPWCGNKTCLSLSLLAAIKCFIFVTDPNCSSILRVLFSWLSADC